MSVAVLAATGMPAITSASGLLAMLEEDQLEIKAYALGKLNACVDDFWAEIAEALPEIEALYEDETFAARQLAALVASKTYFQLAALDDALTFALGAGPLFEVHAPSLSAGGVGVCGSEYASALLSKCIDEYCVQRLRVTEPRADAAEAAAPIDPRLCAIVERLFAACFAQGQYRHALGIAIEARRLDVIYTALTHDALAGLATAADAAAVGAAAAALAAARVPVGAAAAAPPMLAHCLGACRGGGVSRGFRAHVLRLLVTVYTRLPSADYLGMAECLTQLDDAEGVAQLLAQLCDASTKAASAAASGSGAVAAAPASDDRDWLMACQVAFDLFENGTQRFVGRVRALLAPTPPAAADAAAPAADAAAAAAGAGAAAGAPTRASQLDAILSGSLPIALTVEFLCRKNATDVAILNHMKASVEPRNALCHSAVVHAHALMAAGTTADAFLRSNLEWLGRSANWAKFSATASLGVLHRGQHARAAALLAPYLPTAGLAASPYSEGGALFALGLIHANHGAGARTQLLDALRNAGANEVVLHGACLALGLACMGSEDGAVYDELKAVLYTDSAVAGEAAALAMGLVMAGSGSESACDEMLAYAADTQHEKIIRALALAVALVEFGREDAADGTISRLLHAQDDLLRYGGAYALALAYAGSSHNSAIRRLLELAVSDVSDAVQRAAVTALGFVLADAPAQCPRVVALLAQSHNPYVRYGAAMALGVACAGTGGREALELLGGMAADSAECVRQGALIGQALVLVGSIPQTADSRAGTLRKDLERAIADKHEDVMTRFGAILASGILEAGGRNVTVQLMSTRGHKKLPAFVGMALFSNFWYWHPLVPFLSLAFTPAALVGLNASLKMPQWAFNTHASAASLAYPPAVKPDAKAKADKVAAAVLSTTAKAKKTHDKAKAATHAAAHADAPMADAPAAAPAAPKPKPAAASAASEGPVSLSNPARVLPAHEASLSVPPTSRYEPVVQAGEGGAQLLRLSGFVMLRDRTPALAEELLTPAQTGGSAVPADMEEPAPPKPFEFDPAA